NVQASGNFNALQASLLTTATFTGNQNTIIQTLDNNSMQVLDRALSFGTGPGGTGIFGSGPGGNGLYGANIQASGSFNQIQASLLSTVKITGSQNTFLQALDNNSAQVLDTAASFGTGPGGTGILGTGPGGNGLYGANVQASGNFNIIQGSLL